MYGAAAIVILGIHLLFIVWVILGALLTRARSIYATLHILSLVWGLLVEILPWTCPLTVAENWLEQHAGVAPYHGGFLLHYLDALVYPNVSPLLLTAAAVVVFCVNAAVYGRRWRQASR